MTEPVSVFTLRGVPPGQWVPLGSATTAYAGAANLSGAGALSLSGQAVTADQFLWGFQQFPSGNDSYLLRGGANNETAAQQYARHMTVYGRNDIQKLFYTVNLPTTFDATREGTNTGRKVAIVCCNQGGSNAQAAIDIANGLQDAAFRSYTRSVPADFQVELVYNQEADSSFSDGGLGGAHWCTKAQYVAAFNHIAQIIRADKQAGNTPPGVYTNANFMNSAFRQGVWTDDRVPRYVDHLSWDTYLNPPPGSGQPVITGGPTYESGTVNARIFANNHSAAAARILDYNGVSYAGRWGWAEMGAPFRSDDIQSITGRPDGSLRADAFTSLMTELKAAGAFFGCIWDSDVGQWDHRICDKTITPSPVLKTDGQTWNPAIHPSPYREPCIATIRAVMGT